VSVLDQFRDAEQRVAQRLKELEPAVDEYRQLQEVAKRLGIDGSPATASAARSPTRRSASARKRARTPKATKNPSAPESHTKAATTTPASPRRSRRTARPGQRSDDLVKLVTARPGITVREAGEEMGVDPTSLYRVVRRLEQAGTIRKRGRNLEPIATPR
jgi:hypothetical protein